MTTSPAISLLDKYPHLRLLAARRREDVTKHGAVSDNHDVVGDGGRISLLGPGVGGRKKPSAPPVTVPRTRVVAEELFAASVAADDDQWLQFQVETAVPARQQLDQLKLWLVANRPSTIARSAGVGWIAVKFKDKGKKVLEAKAAWDSFEEEKTMEVVNELATQFQVMGGKWMCHLPSGLIDEVWSKLATALMCGGLGPSVYMVKVSPVEDIDPNLARGEHVICVYNTNYKDTEQVMRVENLMRSAGVATLLNYKPDVFSALGIYRNNKWGFRPTIYCSRVMLMEGKSRVETVGTGKWYYNSSKGLQYPSDCGHGEGRMDKENNLKMGREVLNVNVNDTGKKIKEDRNVLNQKLSPTNIPEFCLESMDSMKHMLDKAPLLISNNAISTSRTTGLNMFSMESLDKMKSKETAGVKSDSQETKPEDPSSKESSGQKSRWSHRLTAKNPDDKVNVTKEVGIVKDGKEESKVIGTKSNVTLGDIFEDKKPLTKSWSHRLAVKRDTKVPITRSESTASEPGEKVLRREGTEGTIASETVENTKDVDNEVKEKCLSPSKDKLSKRMNVESAIKSTAVKKPAWLKKLEEMKLKNLDDMKTS